VRNFRQLDVWKKAHEFTLKVYRITADFPNQERFGLTSQIQRASTSIGANIAEGCGRETDGDFKRFVGIARGSACEVEYHLLLARDLKHLDDEAYEPLNADINEVKKILFGLARYLETEKSRRRTQSR
jgi:four helix bundle protein